VKFLLLLGAVFVFAVAADAAGNPLVTWPEAVRMQVRVNGWILVLAAAELIRQIHIFIGERRYGYRCFWAEKAETVACHAERRLGRLDAWNRFRVGRALRWAVVFVVFAVVYARVREVSVVSTLVSLPAILWEGLPWALRVALVVVIAVGQIFAIFWYFSRGGVDVYFPGEVGTRFGDVWGQGHVVARVRECAYFLENPADIERSGGYMPGGILLWGPPGTGKSLIAEAVAGETGKPYVFVDSAALCAASLGSGMGTTVGNGVGILKIKMLFRRLRTLAKRYGGVVVFFDEAAAFGRRGRAAAIAGRPDIEVAGSQDTFARAWADDPPPGLCSDCNGAAYMTAAAPAEMMHPAAISDGTGTGAAGNGGSGVANVAGPAQALLTEMSSLNKQRGLAGRAARRVLGMRTEPPHAQRIMVIMATAMPRSVDEALLRPGRLDRCLEVGYPSKVGRAETFQGYLGKIRNDLTGDQVERLAVTSPRATGATIRETVNEALAQALRDGRDVVTWRDMIRARMNNDHGLPDIYSYAEAERHSVALHEACHAVVAYRLQRRHVIDVATIERRGDIGGFVSGVDLAEGMLTWKSEVETQVMVALASLAGERMFFDGDNTVNVGADLRRATLLVSVHISCYAFGQTLASRIPMIERGMGTSSIDNDRPFGEQVEQKLRELYTRTEQLLADNRRQLLAVTHALEEHRTITGDDVEAIIQGAVGPIVDGRRYHVSGFLEIAESYHQEALRAHSGKQKSRRS
jgi:ATP-dependent Zn protease